MKRLEIKEANAHPFEIEELACKILGIDYDEIDADTEIIENEIYEQFGIDLEIFQTVINRLLPLVDVGRSELTNTVFQGFGDGNCWLVKIEKE